MTSIKEIVDSLLSSRGLRRYKGEYNDASALYPFVLMDTAFQTFDKYVRSVECEYEMNKLKKGWIRNYNLFNKQFFSCFNEEQRDFIIDLMDEFEGAIANDVTICFVQFTNFFDKEEFERQKVLSACMMISIHCQVAELIWEAVYRYVKPKTNSYILACKEIIRRWCDLYYGAGRPSLNPNEDKEICRAVEVLCDKETSFFRKYGKDK